LAARGSGDHHPGASASRAYLEALADIPWGINSAQRAADKQQGPAAPSSGGATGSSNEQGGDASSHRSGATPQEGPLSHRGHTSNLAPGSGPLAATGGPLSLKAARSVLDKQHYGLDKVKDRCVRGGGWAGTHCCWPGLGLCLQLL
jgi:hypothetical protein